MYAGFFGVGTGAIEKRDVECGHDGKILTFRPGPSHGRLRALGLQVGDTND
jgi:hypothetical protein